MVTPADNHSETSTATAGVNPPERASRQRPFAFHKGIFRRDRLKLDERQRFYLLLTTFNVMLVFIMLMLSLRQRLIREVERLEVEVTRVVVEWLACETESAEREVMLSRTPTFTPALTPSPTSSLRSPSLSPTASSTAMPLPTVPSPTAQPTTETPIPTATSTCTPMPTPTTQLPTEPRPTDTPTPTNTPTPTDTPTPTNTPTPTYTPTPPPPDVLGITPAQMVRADSGTPVAVVITGSNFFPGAVANLGFVPVDIPGGVTDTATIYGAVPVSMGTGVYNLTVTNTNTLSDTLPRAFTVTRPVDPDKTLECSYLVTYGGAGDLSDGDDDHVQLIFFDMPDTVTDPVYIRINDPDTWEPSPGQGLDRYKEPAPPGWDTTVRFSVRGGPGAYSHPDAQTSRPTTGVTSGNLLATEAFSQNTDLNGAWYAFGPFVPSSGEYVNGRYVFKLAVVGESGNDGNLYNVALSTSPSTNTAPAGVRAFAFSWTFVLTDTARPGLYPYLAPNVTTFAQHNCDFDYRRGDGVMVVRTPERELQVSGSSISGDGICESSSFDLGVKYMVTEIGTRWALDFTALTFDVPSGDNDVTFWATNQDGTALAIFTCPGIEPPP